MTLTKESGTTQVRTEPINASPLLHRHADTRQAVSATAFVLAGLIAWVFAYIYFFSGFQASHAQHQLYNQFRSEVAEGIAPYAAPIATGHPVAMINSPALGLSNMVVVEGTTPAALQNGPGHKAGTVLPGQVGTSVIFGRAISFGGPFAGLPGLAADDQVTVTTMQGTFTYEVTGVRRNGDPFTPAAADASHLVLVSADGGSPLSAASTIYADLDLVGKAQPANPVSAPDPAGDAMARDTTVATLALLVLALQVLVGGALAVGWARQRWSTVGAWTTGVPVILAGLWLVSAVASRLLPNLL